MFSLRPVSASTSLVEALGIGVTAGLLHAMAETTLLGLGGLRPTVVDLAIIAVASVAGACLVSAAAATTTLIPPVRKLFGTTDGPAALRTAVWSLVVAAYFLVLLKITSYWSDWGAALTWSLPAAPIVAFAWLAVRRKGQRPLVVICATATVAFTFCALQLGPANLGALLGRPSFFTAWLFLPAGLCVAALVAVTKKTSRNSSFQAMTRGAPAMSVLAVAWAVFWAGSYPDVSPGSLFGATPSLAAAASRPNFLLLSLDTVRADHLDLFGYHRETMPNLRRFAEQQCQVVNRMYTVGSWTLPSHASMFTGMYPSEHGAHYPFVADTDPRFIAYSMREDVPTLAEFLTAMGYQTAGIVSNYGVLAQFGLPRGFQYYDAAPGSAYSARGSLWLYRLRAGSWPSAGELLRRSFPAAIQRRSVLFSLREPDYRRAGEINELAKQWLAGHGDNPFFLFLNYMDAHDPYLPAPEDDERFGARPAGDEWFGFPSERLAAGKRGKAVFTAEEIEFLKGQYDAALVSLDRELGRLLSFLRESGLLENTFILVTTDHGEAFFEHGFPDHGNSLYQEEIDGLLLIKAPAAVGPIHASSLMQAVDFFPTLAAVIGQQIPESVSGSPWGNGRDYALSELFCKTCGREVFDDQWPDAFRRDLVAVIKDDHKLIRSTKGPDEIYRLGADSAESIPISDPGLQFLRRGHEIIAARDERVVEGPTGRPTDKTLVERLRGLGYIN